MTILVKFIVVNVGDGCVFGNQPQSPRRNLNCPLRVQLHDLVLVFVCVLKPGVLTMVSEALVLLIHRQ